MKSSILTLNANQSKVLTKELFNHLLEQFPLGNSIMHGGKHWLRVLYIGRLLAKETGANLNVVELFAVIHDCRRKNENFDLEHGKEAAQYAKEIRGKWFDLSDNEMDMLVEACIYHSDGLIDSNITVQTCWDSDRLELGRVGIKPTPSRLCTEFARRKDVIEEAYERSRKPDLL